MFQFGIPAQGPVRKRRKGIHQLTLTTNKADKAAPLEIADSIHSNGLTFRLSECLKLVKLIDVTRRLPIGYKPPDRRAMLGGLLTNLAAENWQHSVGLLTKEAKDFGISINTDGATIVNVPYVNIIGCGVNNPSYQIDVHECTDRAAAGGMKCGRYLASILVPIIRHIENEKDQFGHSLVGCIDVVYGDGASNVKVCGDVLMESSPRITTIHGTEHVISFFLPGCIYKVFL